MNSVYSDVDKFSEKYSVIWRDIYPDISSLKEYSKREKLALKNQLGQSLNAFTAQIKKASNEDDGKWKAELKSMLKQRATTFLNIENQEFENIIVSSFTDVAEVFIDSAKEFDRNMQMKDIAQAIRNVWIMNMIQVIAGREVRHTPSIFAYSMLYPYTDNYLDDPNISKDQKKLFNQRLEQRLKGENIEPNSHNEIKIYTLISMIESEYPRDKYPHVFDSILCIHAGQCNSLNQQKNRLTQAMRTFCVSV